MHQGDVVGNRGTHLAQVFAGGVFKEIFVLRTEYVGFADDRGLHDDDVDHVSDGRNHRWPEPELSCRGRIAPMRTVTGPRSADGLGQDFLGFVREPDLRRASTSEKYFLSPAVCSRCL